MKQEPVDRVDFQEFEMDEAELPSSMRDVIRPSKKYYAIVGPDLTNLTKLKNVDIKIGTIQKD